MAIRKKILKDGTIRYFCDYYPKGRRGARKWVKLPDDVQDDETAGEYDQIYRAAARGEKIPTVAAGKEANVDELFPDYLTWYKTYRRESSYVDLYSVYYAHISPILGNELAAKLNKHHLTIYEKRRAAEGVTNRTINKELSYFGGFLTWCRDEKKLEIAPIPRKKLPSERPIPIVLSVPEVVKFIDALETDADKAFFLCLYSLGMRFNEAACLRNTDIDFENGAARITRKGGKQMIVPLNDWVTTYLEKMKPFKEGYIFATGEEDKPIVNVRKKIARACAKAGIIKHVNPHLFRHSVATHFLGQNTNLRTIQKYLGHAQVSTTEWYTQVAMQDMKNASDSMFSKSSTQKKRGKSK
jgi:integrase/recombinase XerD